jgi:hypothetical protein
MPEKFIKYPRLEPGILIPAKGETKKETGETGFLWRRAEHHRPVKGSPGEGRPRNSLTSSPPQQRQRKSWNLENGSSSPWPGHPPSTEFEVDEPVQATPTLQPQPPLSPGRSLGTIPYPPLSLSPTVL